MMAEKFIFDLKDKELVAACENLAQFSANTHN
jgi:hypothetical protein